MAPAAAAASAPVPAADVAWLGAALGPFALRPAPLPPPPPEFVFGPPPDLSASILGVQPSARIKSWRRADSANNNNKGSPPYPGYNRGTLCYQGTSFLLLLLPPPTLTRTEQNYYSGAKTLNFRFYTFNVKRSETMRSKG